MAEAQFPHCQHCHGSCCKQGTTGATFAVELTEDDLAVSTVHAAAMRHPGGGGGMVLPYIRGRCVFLGEDNRCRIYAQRPGFCRSFDCRDGYGANKGSHSEFLACNPPVVSMLERHRFVTPEQIAAASQARTKQNKLGRSC